MPRVKGGWKIYKIEDIVYYDRDVGRYRWTKTGRFASSKDVARVAGWVRWYNLYATARAAHPEWTHWMTIQTIRDIKQWAEERGWDDPKIRDWIKWLTGSP